METKAFALASPTIDELEGKVSGFAAIFGQVDSGGDRILPGAFKKTIQERFVKYGSIPLTWQHSVDDPLGPLGKVTVLREVGRDELPAKILALAPAATGGLYYEGEITLTDVNKERMKHLVAGSVPGQSIGYMPIGPRYVKENGENVRDLPEIRLFEVASVTIGMMDAALLRGVKADADTKTDFTQADRDKLADSGAAMPDGSFPIRNAGDLVHAMQSIGRAKDPAAAKRHIRARAQALGLTDQLTDAFKATAASEHKAEGGGEDETSCIAMAADLIDRLNRLIAHEAQEQVEGSDEDDDIRLLLCCRDMIQSFQANEQAEAMGVGPGSDAGASSDYGTQLMTLGARLATKAGRRNSSTDTGMLKAAHDSLHTVLGMPHHELDGSAPAPTDDDPPAAADAKAALGRRLRLLDARARAANVGAA